MYVFCVCVCVVTILRPRQQAVALVHGGCAGGAGGRAGAWQMRWCMADALVHGGCAGGGCAACLWGHVGGFLCVACIA